MQNPEKFVISDRTVYEGKPYNTEGRLKKEIEVYDYLDGLGIKYMRLDHSPAFSMEECSERGVILGVHISKNLFLCNAQKTKFYLLMMPGEKRFKTSVFSKLIGSSRLSFAPEEALEKMLNVTPGSASVMGLIFDKECDVTFCVDRAVIENEYIGCHPCINTSSLKIKTSDLLEKFIPSTKHTVTVVDLPDEEA